ncbi:MAG: thioredoxin domain-containing protein, partial [Firmicutes bacterium]|nr:thioredoxin domain-containing protein [Bacillota bacterium]
MNHLKNQTSPYLLQHAENPVEWYPWCEEAFERAKKEDKPIFLSIGYSTCHWCHVMAEECFEDQEVAELLNRSFISIKVDREERPDLDAVYMAACQAMTGNGGWPMSIFMTADQKPFFAGTYFPKHSRMGMAGLLDVLTYIADVWKSNRSRLLNAAEAMHLHLKNMEKGTESGTLEYEAGRRLLNQGILQLKKQFDREYGGFGTAPKFPMPHNLLYLMQQYEERGDKELLQIAEKTLMQMYKGGIFDHLGGGFSRYSTDRYFL